MVERVCETIEDIDAQSDGIEEDMDAVPAEESTEINSEAGEKARENRDTPACAGKVSGDRFLHLEE